GSHAAMLEFKTRFCDMQQFSMRAEVRAAYMRSASTTCAAPRLRPSVAPKAIVMRTVATTRLFMNTSAPPELAIDRTATPTSKRSPMPNLLLPGPDSAPITILLAHGAGAPMDSASMNAAASALSEAGMRVARFEFGYMAARRSGAGK